MGEVKNHEPQEYLDRAGFIRGRCLMSGNTCQCRRVAGLPLSFEPNQGQSAAGVKFLAHGKGYGLFLKVPRPC